MEYSVQKLAQLAGISTRTLRYYDQAGILKPKRINSSGYRIYGKEEVDTLQRIMFYKELNLSLAQIKFHLTASADDGLLALKEQRKKLIQKKQQLEVLIVNIEKTIDASEKGNIMSDKEKFEGFKQNIVRENEEKHGREIRGKYGDHRVEESNRKVMQMSQEDYALVSALEREVIDTLYAAQKTGDPAGKLAQKTADLHRQWLSYYWGSYTKQAHAGLAQMYVDDERFTKYYDAKQPGAAAFLRDAILIYTK